MSPSIEVSSSNLDPPRSSASNSIDSSRRGSLMHVLLVKNVESPNSIAAMTNFTKKRAASLNVDRANNDPRLEDLPLKSSSGHLTSDSTEVQVCLCQPDPKIPRPRNAFILYRQHYQTQVVAQHPGLANPEISKIIGEQWREQPPEVKSDWKRLAEEEKQRHSRQYPGYRYQPRRAGKPNGLRPLITSSTDDPLRCPKCHGRYISTPSTPLTPFTPLTSGFGLGVDKQRQLPPFTRTTELSRQPWDMHSARMESPRVTAGHQQLPRQTQYPPQPLQTHRDRDEEIEMSSPSSGKRRRFNEDTHQRAFVSSSPASYSAPQSFSRVPLSAGGYRQPLPGPNMLSRPGAMGPPQHSPLHQQSVHQYPTRANTFDESLRLPPLQTQMANTRPVSSHRSDARMEARKSQAESVEAMVMTIPYIHKVKTLSRICPPLALAGPQSPAQETRGAVIAVEGADKELLNEVGAFINEYLSKETSFITKTWDSSIPLSVLKPEDLLSPTKDTEMSDASVSAVAIIENPAPVGQNQFVEYLSTITQWHNKSQDIIKYITTSPNATEASAEDIEASATLLPVLKPNILPLALVLGGYSLSISDRFAIRIPINDVYAPVDHWQWMATLWRGIVGPDLTIFVTRVGRDEMNKMGGVEIRRDCSAIVVRVLEDGKVDEKTSRRLGFEFMEAIRNIESGFGKVDRG